MSPWGIHKYGWKLQSRNQSLNPVMQIVPESIHMLPHHMKEAAVIYSTIYLPTITYPFPATCYHSPYWKKPNQWQHCWYSARWAIIKTCPKQSCMLLQHTAALAWSTCTLNKVFKKFSKYSNTFGLEPPLENLWTLLSRLTESKQVFPTIS